LSLGLRLNEINVSDIRHGLHTCILVGSKDGEYIYRFGEFGSADEQEVSDGTLFYEFVVNTANVFTIGFGDTGTTHLTDVDEIMVYNKDGDEQNQAVWDDGMKKYTFTDADWGESIRDKYNLIGEFELCVGMYVLPDLFIYFSFSEIDAGDA
jgi:hypothetical protein